MPVFREPAGLIIESLQVIHNEWVSFTALTTIPSSITTFRAGIHWTRQVVQGLKDSRTQGLPCPHRAWSDSLARTPDREEFVQSLADEPAAFVEKRLVRIHPKKSAVCGDALRPERLTA